MVTEKLKQKCALFSAIVVLTLVFAFIDWKTGYELNFFVFYFIPVCLAAWHGGFLGAGILSIVSAVFWFTANDLSGLTYSMDLYAVWNTIIRLSAFMAIGWAFAEIRKLMLSEKDKASALKKSLAEIKILEGILPVCCQCKKIRTKQGDWQQIESYISHHSAALFSHGYCPECYKKALLEADLVEEETGVR